MMKKRSQEEMIGFALIIIIVAVILLVFLSFSLKKPQKEAVESYEIESFIQAFLQYTSNCKDRVGEYLSVKNLIMACNKNDKCYDENSNERESCEVAELNLKDIIKESWNIDGTPVKGYELKITSGERELLFFENGEKTKSYKGSTQEFSDSGDLIDISFTAYY